jgi:hypothetical protein
MDLVYQPAAGEPGSKDNNPLLFLVLFFSLMVFALEVAARG